MNRQERRAAERAAAKGGRPAGAPRARAVLDRAAADVAGGRAQQAERRCRQVLDADPGEHEARRLLAGALRLQGRLDEAMLEARRVVTARPEDPLGHEELGQVLARQDRIPESIGAFERAIRLSPGRPHGHACLGAAYLDVGMLEAAAACFRRVTELAPHEPAGIVNLGIVAQLQGRFADAAETFDQALTLAPTSPDARWNLALALLGSGDLARGWAEYEYGFPAGQRTPDRRFTVPCWDGADLSGRTLLVWREQGLGDEVRFSACYRDVATRAEQLVIETDPRLVSLFRRSFPSADVRRQTVDPGSPTAPARVDGIDLHCPAGSLPRHVRPTLDAFPRHAGHLTADPARRGRWRERLDGLGPGLTVGICWRSMNLATSRLQHYTTLDEWEPVLRIPGIRLINLQYGAREHREAELQAIEQRLGVAIHRWDDIDYTADLEDVAALTAELDVVVGPNTFATILAGAVGVETFVLGLPAVWQHGQDVDPWAPTARHLTRQWHEPWLPVMERAAALLTERAAAVGG